MWVKDSVLHALKTHFHVFSLLAFFGRGCAFLKAREKEKYKVWKNAEYGTLWSNTLVFCNLNVQTTLLHLSPVNSGKCSLCRESEKVKKGYAGALNSWKVTKDVIWTLKKLGGIMQHIVFSFSFSGLLCCHSQYGSTWRSFTYLFDIMRQFHLTGNLQTYG